MLVKTYGSAILGVNAMTVTVEVNVGEGVGFYLYEAGDGFAVICYWSEEDYIDHYRRYAISWDEEGNAIVGEATEGHIGFIPDNAEPAVREDEETMAEAMSAVLDEIKSLKAEVAALKGQPAAKPAHEEFKSEGSLKVNAPKGYGKFVERFSK